MVKENVEDFTEFHFSLLLYSSFLFTWDLPIVCEKGNWQKCFKFLVLGGGNSLIYRLWKFSVTKPIGYKDVFVNNFCSLTFRLGNALVVEPFL